jgi:hypothetical protein
MLGASDPAKRYQRSAAGAPLDFQQHLRLLEERGLLTRIDRAIDKDSELHPLVRWQFQGGLTEDQRRAFYSQTSSTAPEDVMTFRLPLELLERLQQSTPSAWAGLSKTSAMPGRRLSLRQFRRSLSQPLHARKVVTKGSDLVRPGEGPCQPADSDIDTGVSIPLPTSPRRSASRAILKMECRTWAPTEVP